MNMQAGKVELLAQAKGNGQGVASQATHIEQSRAIAQVQGALVVAQQRPRDTMRAVDRMREACELEQLAEHAFFSYSRGGSNITGPSIHLATELARCWGNVDYGISELRRDEGDSEMLAYAWDLETNTKVINSFIVPHMRDTRGGGRALTDMRDIYENNANNAARRLRECIFRVLPKAYVEEAKTICAATLEHGGGKPMAERRRALLEAFAEMRVTRAQLEKRVGRKADQLTPLDISTLRVLYQSIRRGETTAEAEFPDDTAEQAMGELRKPEKATKKAEARKAPPPRDDPPAPESEPAPQAQPRQSGDFWSRDSLTIPANGDIQAWAGRMQKAVTAAPSRELLMQLQTDNQAAIDRLMAEDEAAGRELVTAIKQASTDLFLVEEGDDEGEAEVVP